jgi:hypothetical protein
LDAILRWETTCALLDAIATRVEQKLDADPSALMAWEPVPLAVYSTPLPEGIASSWVFVLRAGAVTGAERHPNSRQRMMSYRGTGDMQVWSDQGWQSHLLVSDRRAPLDARWVSIPPETWHQVVVPSRHWAVVSFHTVADTDLIEERPGPTSTNLPVQRRYVSPPDK